MPTHFVVHDHRTDRIRLEFAADHGRRYAVFFQIAQQVDVEKQPVCNHDQGLDAAIEQHLQITLEAAALIVYVRENGQIRRLVESIFDAPQNEGTERVRHVEDHDSDGMAALAAKGAGKLVGTVSQLLRRALDAFLGDSRDVTRQRRIVQNDGYRGRGKSALLRHVTNSYHCRGLAPDQRTAVLTTQYNTRIQQPPAAA